MKKILTFLFSIAITYASWAQTQISGVVKDANNNVLPGANVLEKGTQNGATTDFDGKFQLTIQEGAILVISYSGFETQEIAVDGKKTFTITLQDGLQLEEVVVTGSRTPARSNTSSPLPVDIVGVKELQATGQTTFDKALQYKIPSFNTVNTPVNDATSLLDPYEIRNMGPSRTLILINGKRKNLSALLYTQTSPGRGETGADISGIPTDAIKTIQILRDGASAQYGSDAIAGVMNIILKDDYKNGSATFRSGLTGEGDGEMLGISVNNGTKLGEGKGFINYTVDFSKTALANRPGTVDAAGEAADFGADISDVQEFLSRRPDAGNVNGSPETTAAKFLINGSVDLKDDSELYFNAAYIYKKVNSFANYRTPYWRTIEDFPYLGNFFPGSNSNNQGSYTDAYGNTFQGNGYDGYVPTFEGDLNDYNATVGFKSKLNGWNVDVSATFGGNQQTYKVSNSHNRNEVFVPTYDSNTGTFEPTRLYQENSQINFDPGGTAFSHVVGNIDISKILSDQVAVAFGAEFRTENFEVIEGELASYDGGGADSFAGNRPENSGNFNRYNLGAYASIDWDINKDFLLSGTARIENYSDFGSTFVWKASSRYKFAEDKYTLRASISTGFRAPTLHQIYTQKAQYSFVPGQGIQVGGLVNNVSPQARLLNIPNLDAESSTNFTVGIGGKPFKNFSFTIDYYSISVEDRIVLGTEIGPSGDPTNPLDIVLTNNNLSDISFFSNALDTKTSGLDFVFSYNNLKAGNGKLGFNLSGNYTIQNERDGDVKNPAIVEGAGQSVVNETQEALFFTSRPRTKWILGVNYDIGKFSFSLNNTYFGKTIFKQQGLDTNLRTEFTPKIVSDLGVSFNVDKNWTIGFNANNILNVLPEWSFKAENAAGEAILNDPAQVKNQSNLITFNQRYSQMTYDGYHFSQLGSLFNLSVNYKF
ncbi:iron complex outermembrane recepter protein [Tenacibaculum sp. MAR_2009_124]|uniref:TonB-dependent receptor n=1 Tax=Tenacibaculum sp. MAR_2009_124 TaxID=1250059 RepID=UPI00089D74A9|nr:TonB-dependent receptor [Tenacibaculum sp. MAR_2009_124]SEB38251.1 iron complex outermembrane recepter protein [Tenacibaculum sp. MAR_2009_124]